MKTKYKDLNEQIDRMKSLFTEERLYGNLVEQDEEVEIEEIGVEPEAEVTYSIKQDDGSTKTYARINAETWDEVIDGKRVSIGGGDVGELEAHHQNQMATTKPLTPTVDADWEHTIPAGDNQGDKWKYDGNSKSWHVWKKGESGYVAAGDTDKVTIVQLDASRKEDIRKGIKGGGKVVKKVETDDEKKVRLTKEKKEKEAARAKKIDDDARAEALDEKDAQQAGFEPTKDGKQPEGFNTTDWSERYVNVDGNLVKWYKKGTGGPREERRRDCKKLLDKVVPGYGEERSRPKQRAYFKTIGSTVKDDENKLESDVTDKIKFCISKFKTARFMKSNVYKRFIGDFNAFGGEWVEKGEEESGKEKDKTKKTPEGEWTRVNSGTKIRHLEGPNFEIETSWNIFRKDANDKLGFYKAANWDGNDIFTKVMTGALGKPALKIDGEYAYEDVDEITVTDVKGKKGKRKGYITVSGSAPE